MISELQNVVSNIKTNRTFTDPANYWAPLIDEDDDDDGDNEEDDDGDHNSMPIQMINYRRGATRFKNDTEEMDK